MKISEDFRYFCKDTKFFKSNTRTNLNQGKIPNASKDFFKRFENDAEIARLKAKLNEITKNKNSFNSISKDKTTYTPFAKLLPRSNSENKRFSFPHKPVYQIRSKLVSGPLSVPPHFAKILPKPLVIPIQNPPITFKSKEKPLPNPESRCDSSYSISGWDFN